MKQRIESGARKERCDDPPVAGKERSRCVTMRCGDPPDAGWSWVVLLASFLSITITDGIVFSSGVFLPRIMENFQTNKAVTSWAISLLWSGSCCVGPVAAALIETFGCRKVSTVGTLLASAAMLLCSLSTNVGMYIFLYGFLGGIGIGLAYLPSYLMISIYFKKKRAMATGIGVCGAGVGVMIFAPFGEHLLSEFGWRGAHWILAGLLLNIIVFNRAFFPLREMMPKTTVFNDDNAIHQNLITSEDGNITISISQVPEESLEYSPCASDDVVMDLETHECNGNPPCELTLSAIPHDNEKHSPEINSSHSGSYYQLNGVTEINNFTKTKSRDTICISSYSNSHISSLMHLASIDDVPIQLSKCSILFNIMHQVKDRIFDRHVLTNPKVLLFALSSFMAVLGYLIPYTYLPMKAETMHYTSSDAAFLISIIGISSVVSRISIGRAVDKRWVGSVRVHGILLMLAGIVTGLVPLYNNYAILACYSVLYGLFIASISGLGSAICIDLVGMKYMAAAYGFVFFCDGIAALIGPPIAGLIADETGDFNGSFYFAGITLFVAGVLCYPLQRLIRNHPIVHEDH